MKVLGIDPGTAACGYGIVHVSGGRVTALASGCWTTGARERPELRLRVIFEGVQELIAAHAPDAVAIEESYRGGRRAHRTLRRSGPRRRDGRRRHRRALSAPSTRPTRVKQSVCGHGHADKGQVQRMVKMLLSLAGDPADLARGRRARRRDLPRADAAARADGIVIARLRGTPAGRSADGLAARRQRRRLPRRGHAGRAAAVPRAGERSPSRRSSTSARTRCSSTGSSTRRSASCSSSCSPSAAIGPKVALAVVSGSPASELRRAIALEDHARFQAIPGIGKRTAERIVLELKEKVSLTADDAARIRGRRDAHASRRAGRARRARLHGARGGAATPDVDPELPPAERVRLALRAG